MEVDIQVFCLVLGLVIAYIGDVLLSIANYFLEKAYFYRHLRKRGAFEK